MSNMPEPLQPGPADQQRYQRGAFLGLIVGSVAALAGAGRSSAASTRAGAATVGVQLKEFKVVPSVRSVRAGKVVFTARNTGKLPHNLVVLRTNLAPGKLPVAGSVAK